MLGFVGVWTGSGAARGLQSRGAFCANGNADSRRVTRPCCSDIVVSVLRRADDGSDDLRSSSSSPKGSENASSVSRRAVLESVATSAAIAMFGVTLGAPRGAQAQDAVAQIPTETVAQSVDAEDPDLKTKPTGLQYKFLVQNDVGRQAVVGDLVGIRFKASYNGRVFDDTFATAEPFFIRVGSNNVPRGIEEAMLMMRLGDRMKLVVPGKLAFGKKGRRASPGIPMIPPDATIVYELELSEFPGYMKELLDMGDGVEY